MKFSKKITAFVFSALVLSIQISIKNVVQVNAKEKVADTVTYVTFSNMDEAIPVSYIRQGKQLLTGNGEENVYSQLYNTILKDAPAAEQLTHKLDKAMYKDGRYPHFSCTIMTSGEWELFPEQAIYQAYSIQHSASAKECCMENLF